MEFTKQNVLKWMHDNLEAYEDVPCLEIHMTEMAEGAANAFGQAEQPGPLDDEDHWIWDAATEVSDIYKSGLQVNDDL